MTKERKFHRFLLHAAQGSGVALTFFTGTFFGAGNILWIISGLSTFCCLLLYSYSKSELEEAEAEEKQQRFEKEVQLRQFEAMPAMLEALRKQGLYIDPPPEDDPDES